MRYIFLSAWRLRKRNMALLLVLICLATLGVSLWQEQLAQGEVIALAPVLKDRVIVIDPGHGGVDPGAVGRNKTLEKDITLEVAKRLALVISQSGAAVILTRDGDNDLSDPDVKGLLAKKRQDLKRRVDIANERGAEVYLSIHVNSYPSANLTGAQTFYQSGQEGGRVLAEAIQDELRRVLKNTTRVAKGMDFYTNRVTRMPSATVEIGFMSNPEEEKLLSDSNYQNKVVWGIYVGVIRYFAQEQKSGEEQGGMGEKPAGGLTPKDGGQPTEPTDEVDAKLGEPPRP